MNIYEKIVQARIDFQNLNKNSFAQYKYYALEDILPAIKTLEGKYKFITVLSFNEIATLEIIDMEKPDDRVIFTSPMSEANLKGCHAVQNLGAVQTYLKRYLYQNAFEIIEADMLDLGKSPVSPAPAAPAAPIAPKTSTEKIVNAAMYDEPEYEDLTLQGKPVQSPANIGTDYPAQIRKLIADGLLNGVIAVAEAAIEKNDVPQMKGIIARFSK